MDAVVVDDVAVLIPPYMSAQADPTGRNSPPYFIMVHNVQHPYPYARPSVALAIATFTI